MQFQGDVYAEVLLMDCVFLEKCRVKICLYFCFCLLLFAAEGRWWRCCCNRSHSKRWWKPVGRWKDTSGPTANISTGVTFPEVGSGSDALHITAWWVVMSFHYLFTFCFVLINLFIVFSVSQSSLGCALIKTRVVHLSKSGITLFAENYFLF